MNFLSRRARPVCYESVLGGPNNDAVIPEIWSATTLGLLEEQMVIGSLVNRDFSDEIRNLGDTVNTRIPNEFVAYNKARTDNVTPQTASTVNVPVELNQHAHVSFYIEDNERSLALEDLIRLYLNPAAIAMGRRVDQILFGQVYRYMNNAVGNLGDLSVSNVKRRLLSVGQKFDELNAPNDGQRWLFVSPQTKTDILELDLFNAADKKGDDGTALRRASLGEILGLEVAMGQNVMAHTAADLDALQANELGADASAGDTVITVDSGAGFIVGEYITLEGDLMPYKIIGIATNDLTLNRPLRVDVPASASDIQPTATGTVDEGSGYAVGWSKAIHVDGGPTPRVGQLVSFSTAGSPNVHLAGEYSITRVVNTAGSDFDIFLDRPLETAIADGDIVGYGHAGSYNFALHPNAVTLVARPPAVPMANAGAISGVAMNPRGNLAMRTTISYDGLAQKHLVTMDMYLGVAVLYSQLGVPMLGN